MCVATHHHSPHKTALHYNQAKAHTHTQSYTQWHINKHYQTNTPIRKKPLHYKPLTMHMHWFAYRLSQFCYTWTAFPFLILVILLWLYPCLLYVYVLCIYVYVYTYIVVFGILMEFVLYATVIAGTTNTHQHKENPSLRWSVMMMVTPLRLLHPLSLNSSIVFCLRQRIASGWTVAIAANSSLLFLLTFRWLSDQTDTEKKLEHTKKPTNHINTTATAHLEYCNIYTGVKDTNARLHTRFVLCLTRQTQSPQVSLSTRFWFKLRWLVICTVLHTFLFAVADADFVCQGKRSRKHKWS